MPLTLVTPPAGYPLTLAEVKNYCQIGPGYQEPTPQAPTATLAGLGAGNVDNGAHRYLWTFATATGETNGGEISAPVTVADHTANGQVALTVPIGGNAVTARKLYRTKAGQDAFFLAATVADNTTTSYVDNVSDASLGAGVPSVNTTDDPLLGILLASATTYGETTARRAFLTQTWELTLDSFPPWFLVLPKPRLQSVVSITYTDASGNAQTLDPSAYRVDTKSEPARLTPAFGLIWPVTRWQTNAVTVRFICGYGAAADVPACIKNWMLLRLRTLYENRNQLAIDIRLTLIQLPPSYVDGLLDPETAEDWSWAVTQDLSYISTP